jgi:membrane protease YdiL (CAAX protease family)
LAPTPVAIFLIAGFALCVYHYFGGDGFFTDHLMAYFPWKDVRVYYTRCLYWCLSPFVTLVVLPQSCFWLIRRFLRDQPTPEMGWRLGEWKLGGAASVAFTAVALALVGVVSFTKDFRSAYPLCIEAKHSLPYFLGYELAFAAYFVAWESFFRGFLTFGLEKTFGMWAAFVQMLPFVVIYFDKPVLEAMSSVLGGVALGWLALRTRSFLYGAFIHAAMAISLDLFVVGRTGLG